MGRKYRELKEALKNNPVRSLMVVDDAGIRAKLFAEAAAVIKKIETVERDRDRFFEKDQNLFQNWFDLTFRPEKQLYEDKLQTYRRLAKFQNALMAVSEMMSVDLPEAYAFLQDEEQRYEKGTEAERRAIEARRQEREAYVHKAVEREFGFSSDEDWSDDSGESSSRENAAEETDGFDEGPVDVSDLSKQERSTYEMLKGLSQKEIRELFSSREMGFPLLMAAIDLAFLTEDFALVLHIWEALPEKNRQALVKSFSAMTGDSLPDLIRNFQLRVSGEISEELFEKMFEEIGVEAGLGPIKEKLSGREAEELKLVYRQLVRRIHPDSQSPDESESFKKWSAKIWHQVQEAYQEKDLETLRRLEILAKIHLRDLRSMSLEEIRGSARWLEEELQDLQHEMKELRRHPAWKFSTKRSFDSLLTKIRKKFQKDLEPLQKDIDRLEAGHAYFAAMAKRFKAEPSGRTSRQRKKTAPKMDPRQGSLF